MLFDPISYVSEMDFFKQNLIFRAFQSYPRFSFQGELLRSITLEDRAANRCRRGGFGSDFPLAFYSKDFTIENNGKSEPKPPDLLLFAVLSSRVIDLRSSH